MTISIDAGSASKLPPAGVAVVSRDKPTSGKAAIADVTDGSAEAVGGREKTGLAGRKQIEQKVDHINRQLQLKSVSVQFQIEPGYKDVVLKVVDQEDGKVVLQIPSEELLRIAKVMGQLKGVLVEKTA